MAYPAAVPPAQRILALMPVADGALAGSVGSVIGVGAGRGTTFLFIISGLLTLLLVLASHLQTRVRVVEDELPNALPEEAGPTA